MMSKGCSDVVESRVEQAFRCRNAQECSFYFGFGTAPDALANGGARGLLTTARRGEPTSL